MEAAPNDKPIKIQEQEGSKLEEKKEVKQEGKSISNFVNKELVDNLVQSGFPQAVAEKAIFLTGNKNIDDAITWIENHQYDSDYLEELRIIEYFKKGRRKTNHLNQILQKKRQPKRLKNYKR